MVLRQLHGQEHDAQGDHGLNWRRRHIYHPKSCQAERHTMRDSESGDRLQQPGKASHDQQQPRHEQKVIDTR